MGWGVKVNEGGGEYTQTGRSQGQKGSISAPWEQPEVTWSALLVLQTQQTGAPLLLECAWKAKALSTSCS